jgi:ribosomal protein L11 methyltransferase
LLKKENIRYSLEIFPGQNWNENWKKFFKITKVCEGLYVLPPWKKTRRLGLKIYINPALAFGTGTHESTQIAMYFIYKYLYPKTSFLDVGTGSGILSILAKKLGATTVIACDIDPSIKENFFENLNLNGLKENDIKLILNPIDTIKDSFDFVVCNIEYQHMFPLLKKLEEKTKKFLILSGLLKGELELVIKELNNYTQFKILERKEKGNWEGAIIKKK